MLNIFTIFVLYSIVLREVLPYAFKSIKPTSIFLKKSSDNVFRDFSLNAATVDKDTRSLDYKLLLPIYKAAVAFQTFLNIIPFWYERCRPGSEIPSITTPELLKEHIFYGRMLRPCYDLLVTDEKETKLFGKFITKKLETFNDLIPAVFPGYKVLTQMKVATGNTNSASSRETQLAKGLKFFSESEYADPAFMGYVAYNEKKKDLAIMFRGTQLVSEWLLNAGACVEEWTDESTTPTPTSGVPKGFTSSNLILAYFGDFLTKNAIFHAGFKQLYETAFDYGKDAVVSKLTPYNIYGANREIINSSPSARCYQVLTEILEKGRDIETITVCGHSLGAALTVVCSYHMGKILQKYKETHPEFKKNIAIRSITYACPATVNKRFYEEAKELNITQYHYLTRGDLVPLISRVGSAVSGAGYKGVYHEFRTDPEDKKINLVRPDKLKKLGLPSAFSLDVIGDWHNLEHTIYNAKQLLNIPANATFLNFDCDLIDSKKIPNVPVNWYFNFVKSQSIKDVDDGKFDIKKFASTYKAVLATE